MILSAVWADDSKLSLKRSAQPLLLAIAAAGFVKHFDRADSFIGCGRHVGSSTTWVHRHTREWNTFYRSPTDSAALSIRIFKLSNVRHCLPGVARALCEPQCRGGRFNWRWLMPLVIGLAFLYLTRSRTTAVALVAGFTAFFLVKAPFARTLIVILIGALLTPAFAVIWLGAGD